MKSTRKNEHYIRDHGVCYDKLPVISKFERLRAREFFLCLCFVQQLRVPLGAPLLTLSTGPIGTNINTILVTILFLTAMWNILAEQLRSSVGCHCPRLGALNCIGCLCPCSSTNCLLRTRARKSGQVLLSDVHLDLHLPHILYHGWYIATSSHEIVGEDEAVVDESQGICGRGWQRPGAKLTEHRIY